MSADRLEGGGGRWFGPGAKVGRRLGGDDDDADHFADVDFLKVIVEMWELSSRLLGLAENSFVLPTLTVVEALRIY